MRILALSPALIALLGLTSLLHLFWLYLAGLAVLVGGELNAWTHGEGRRASIMGRLGLLTAG